jgi:hypothetical protein
MNSTTVRRRSSLAARLLPLGAVQTASATQLDAYFVTIQAGTQADTPGGQKGVPRMAKRNTCSTG